MEEARNLAQTIARILYDKKALNITALDVSQMTVITDAMVIASGRNALQVKALADDLEDKLSELGYEPARKEGQQEGRWIVLDYRRSGIFTGWISCGRTTRIGSPCPSKKRKNDDFLAKKHCLFMKRSPSAVTIQKDRGTLGRKRPFFPS